MVSGSPSPGLGLGFTQGHEIAHQAGLRFREEHLTRGGVAAGWVTTSQQTRAGFQVSQ